MEVEEVMGLAEVEEEDLEEMVEVEVMVEVVAMEEVELQWEFR